MNGGRLDLPRIQVIRSPIALSLAGVVRNRNSKSDDIRKALSQLGYEFSREILSRHARADEVITPLGEPAAVVNLDRGQTAVVATKGDYDTFGLSIATGVEPSIVGYMNFEGRRAQEALNTPVREIQLPTSGGRIVETLVIAKSVLATGCTAISLTDTAVDCYRPTHLVIASIFYSESGISELGTRFPTATIVVLGKPDKLDNDGILHPGVGLLEDRM